MRYGSLTVICGPMFSGKTSHIIGATQGRVDAIVFKPLMDTRYAVDEIMTHTGESQKAFPVCLPEDMLGAINYQLVCLDEIQFFQEPHYGGDIVRAIKVLLNASKDVVVAGLDMDWRGDPFPVTASLISMADQVIKLKSRCGICRQSAGKTYKKTRQGDSVELGHNNIYDARCNEHWSIPQ